MKFYQNLPAEAQSAIMIISIIGLIALFIYVIFTTFTYDIDRELQMLSRKVTETKPSRTRKARKIGERIFNLDRNAMNKAQLSFHFNLMNNFCQKFPQVQPTELIK